MTEQLSFFSQKNPISSPVSAPNGKSNPAFLPWSMDRALDKPSLAGHEMLILRTHAKKGRFNPKKFLYAQTNEILFKRTGADTATLVRLLIANVDKKITDKK